MSASRSQSSLGALGLLVSCASSLACAGILGIEDAECDSSFPECSSVSGGGTGGNSGGMGGTFEGPGPVGGGGAGGNMVAQGGTGGMAGAGGSVDDRPLCVQYCERIQTGCVGANQQYASPEACLAACELLAPGQVGDRSGNTVQCRMELARLASVTGEPGMYCFSAGPGGAGICGEDCEGFCTLMTAKCTQLGSYENCLTACANVPDLSEPPDNVRFSINIDEGDSLQCRLYHVCAATLDPVLHCQHAAGVSICAP